MKHYFMIQEENKEGGASGGAPTNKETPPIDQSKTPAPPEADGSKFDEFGYEKEKTPVEPGKEGTPPPKEETKVENPATGYTEEPPKVDDPPVIPPPPVPKVDLGYELDTKDLHETDVKKLTEFAKTHKLTKEVAQGLVDDRKAEAIALKKVIEDGKAAQEKAIKETKAAWHKELKTDPTFGGENFDKNLMKVEKVLAEFLPNTKKVLTEGKTMLPPYVMRDLCKLADHIFSTEKLTTGDPKEPVVEAKQESPLDFYT